jgi:hypothetical protein
MLEMSEVSDILWKGGWLTWGLDTDLVILKLLMQIEEKIQGKTRMLRW